MLEGYLIAGLYFYLWFVLLAKRLHDTGISAWWTILIFPLMWVPLVGWLIGLLVLFWGPLNDVNGYTNGYGHDPRFEEVPDDSCWAREIKD
jgi:uncharacterized membrane protein YhaH (DUF805 family)